MPILAPGSMFNGQFKIIESLGEGGMGHVYKARHAQLERIVALKVLHEGLITDDDARHRFEREGKILSSIQHPNIPTVYSVGVCEGKIPYIAMEFVKSQSLRALLDRGPLSWRQASLFIADACETLKTVHALDVTHRDLKPTNLLVTGGDRLMIVDFGLAISENSGKVTKTGMILGSVPYMSPEQCLGKKADPRTDIYALGCILYECLCLKPPFADPNPFTVIKQHVQDTPESARLLAGNSFPEALERIIKKCLAKNPEARYQTTMELREDLLQLIENPSDVTPAKKQEFGKSVHLIAATMSPFVLLFAIALAVQLSGKRNPTMPVMSTAQSIWDKVAVDLRTSKSPERLAAASVTLEGFLQENQSPIVQSCGHLIKAYTLLDSHEFEKSLAECKKSCNLSNHELRKFPLVAARALLLQAQLLQLQDNYLDEIPLLEKCVTILNWKDRSIEDPLPSLPSAESSQVVQSLEQAYIRSGKAAAGVIFLSNELRNNQKNKYVAYALINLEIDGNLLHAQELIEQRSRISPKDVGLICLQIKLLRKQQRFNAANTLLKMTETYVCKLSARGKEDAFQLLQELAISQIEADYLDEAMRISQLALGSASRPDQFRSMAMLFEKLQVKAMEYRPDLSSKCTIILGRLANPVQSRL